MLQRTTNGIILVLAAETLIQPILLRGKVIAMHLEREEVVVGFTGRVWK